MPLNTFLYKRKEVSEGRVETRTSAFTSPKEPFPMTDEISYIMEGSPFPTRNGLVVPLLVLNNLSVFETPGAIVGVDFGARN